MPGTEVTRRRTAALDVHTVAQEKWAEIVQMLPVEDETADEVVDRIMLQLLEASSWEALNDPWQKDTTDEILGVEQVIDSIQLRPSDFKDGRGIFLVVKGYHPSTGNPIVWTTSAASTVGQLAKAYVMGWFPIKVTLVRAERPTAKGYYPQHLIVHGVQVNAAD